MLRAVEGPCTLTASYRLPKLIQNSGFWHLGHSALCFLFRNAICQVGRQFIPAFTLTHMCTYLVYPESSFLVVIFHLGILQYFQLCNVYLNLASTNNISGVRNCDNNMISLRYTRGAINSLSFSFFMNQKSRSTSRCPLLSSCPSLSDFFSPPTFLRLTLASQLLILSLIKGGFLGTMEECQCEQVPCNTTPLNSYFQKHVKKGCTADVPLKAECSVVCYSRHVDKLMSCGPLC